MIERDAIELAKCTPASGWGELPDPATVTLNFNKAELEARIRRAHRQLAEGGNARQPGETHQQCADRLGASPHPYIEGRMSASAATTLFHTIRVAYLTLEALP